MKLALALLLIATAASAQQDGSPPCQEEYSCKQTVFHVTHIESRNATANRDVCHPGDCRATRYELTGWVRETTGKHGIAYKAWCYDVVWLAGPTAGEHDECVKLQAGVDYVVNVFPAVINFFGNPRKLYAISSKHELK